MTNTHARAHVVGLAPIPITDLENYQPSDDESDNDQTNDTIPKLSRKEKRKQKKQRQQYIDGLPTPPDSEPDSPFKPPNNPPKKKQHISNPASTTALPLSLPFGPSMPPGAQKVYPLLICSIGNPGAAYQNTLHSAGHTILTEIQTRGLYKPFTKGLSGLVSRPNTTSYKFSLTGFQKQPEGRGVGEGEDDFTLWQSTTLMNVSGGGVKKAWMTFEKEQRERGLQGRLVVVHDELEAALGKVSIKDGGASPKGHNGLKSCQASLGNLKWWRVGVGIGRPESREPAVVSRYVLSKMSRGEQATIERAAVGVLGALRNISEGKR